MAKAHRKALEQLQLRRAAHKDNYGKRPGSMNRKKSQGRNRKTKY